MVLGWLSSPQEMIDSLLLHVSLSRPTRMKQSEYGAAPGWKGGGNGRSQRNPANKRRSTSRFPHAKIRERPRRESNQARLGGSEFQTRLFPEKMSTRHCLEWSGEVWVALDIKVLRDDEDETRRYRKKIKQRRGERELPEKTRRPMALSGTIPTCGNPGIDPTANRTVSPRWEVSSLYNTLPLHLSAWRDGNLNKTEHFARCYSQSGTSGGTIPAFDWSDFGTPWKTEFRMTGPGIEPGSSRLRVHDVQRRNARAGETGHPRENPPTSGILRSDSPRAKIRGATPPGIEPGSPWRDASSLATTSPRPLTSGATVPERLTRSPPTKANQVQSPAGSPDFRKWESCRTMPLVSRFSRGSPVSPAPSIPAPFHIHLKHAHRLSRPQC
ncbi:hypothetical protein PR048_006644 [Dryococelus australis]|uniref:Uncharacterized protein n=1 Tax=Dryococelus australis TaxID=614101 RepID=A0ABQ9IBI8_9NEOP|nr:hypothetical protein PR048_006644 [Dryococelus australis]